MKVIIIPAAGSIWARLTLPEESSVEEPEVEFTSPLWTHLGRATISWHTDTWVMHAFTDALNLRTNI